MPKQRESGEKKMEELAVPGMSRLKTMIGLFALETALVICWSSGFVGVRFATGHTPVFVVLLWRSLVSAFLLLPFAFLIGPRLRLSEIAVQVVVGALAMSGYLAGFSLAIFYGVPTGLVALISDMLPLAVALLSLPMLGQVITAGQWRGFLVGMIGVMVATAGSIQIGRAPLWAYSLPVLGMLSLAIATLLQKRTVKITMAVHQSLCIQCFSAAAIFWWFARPQNSLAYAADWHFLAGIFWLVLFATFGGYGLYYLCLRKSSPARVSSVLYLSPPVTMIWAWAMFGEPLSWAMAIGFAISLIGVIIAARSP
jgi:drug/metabolite transporter (DMT)-like permease